jgi:hypothetical protein
LTDEQFDDIAKQSLSYESLPSESTWNRVRPRRWSWLPTTREILACGSVGALALGLVWVGIGHVQTPDAPNPIVQNAMHDETRFVLNSVSRIDRAKGGGGVPLRG